MRLRFWIVLCVFFFPVNAMEGESLLNADQLTPTQVSIQGEQGPPLGIPTPAVITYGQAFKEIVKICGPYMLSQVWVTANGMWNDRLFAQLGPTVLASVPATLTWEFLIMGTAMGALRATSILAGDLNGRYKMTNGGDPALRASMGNVNKTSTILVLVYSAVTLPLFLKAGAIVKGLGIVTEQPVINELQNYFDGFVLGVPSTLLLFNEEQFSLCLGDSYIPLLYAALYAGSASLMAYPLALGEWGASAHGVTGIGYAMSAGATLGLILLRVHYLISDKYRSLGLYDFRTLKWKAFKLYMLYGIPLGLSNSIGLIADFFYAQFVTRAGLKIADAYASSSAYFEQLNVALLGFSAAVNSLVTNYDPRHMTSESAHQIAKETMKRLMRVSMVSAMGLTVVLCVPPLIFQTEFIKFFGDSSITGDTLALAKEYLWINFADTLLNTCATTLGASLHGLKDIAAPFLIDFVSDAATVGLGAVASYGMENPTVVVAAGLVGGGIGVAAYSLRWAQLDTSSIRSGIAEKCLSCRNAWTRFKSWIGLDMSIAEAFQ